ncbi:MAG: MarR family winged helix-turn-helix transcriptional regulator [candidate division KSB1 bacterium]|nr:MarR family winged helix-turn-helix transcriptional regulator [candidate division KSB1 bacterium]
MNTFELQLLRRYIRILERHVDQQLKNHKGCCGVSLAQCHALVELDVHDKCTVTALAERLNLDKSTASRTVENLVQRDLVTRFSDPNDRRFYKIALSENGKSFVDSINFFCNEMYETVCCGMMPDEQQTVLEGLRLLTEAIQKKQNSGGLDEKCRG